MRYTPESRHLAGEGFPLPKDVHISGRRRRFSAEFKVEAAHRVIDTGRSITEVAAELTLDENALGVWARAERAQMQAWMRNRVGAVNGC